MKKRFLALAVAVTLLVSGCEETAYSVSNNISNKADRFDIPRKIRVYNIRTGEIVYETQGLISVLIHNKKLDILIKEGKVYKKHIVGLNNQITYILEDLEGTKMNGGE